MLLNPGSDSLGKFPTRNFAVLSNSVIELNGIPAGKYTVMMPDSAAGPRAAVTVAELDLGREWSGAGSIRRRADEYRKTGTADSGGGRRPQQLMALQNGEHKVVAVAPAHEKGEVQLLGILAGKYVVLAGTPTRNYSVVRIGANGAQSSGHSLDVAAGATTKARFLLWVVQAAWKGFARHGGKGVAGVMVALVPKDPWPIANCFAAISAIWMEASVSQAWFRANTRLWRSSTDGTWIGRSPHRRPLCRSRAQDLDHCGGPRGGSLVRCGGSTNAVSGNS